MLKPEMRMDRNSGSFFDIRLDIGGSYGYGGGIRARGLAIGSGHADSEAVSLRSGLSSGLAIEFSSSGGQGRVASGVGRRIGSCLFLNSPSASTGG